jgi:uncharacterized delta-60 repeat protein
MGHFASLTTQPVRRSRRVPSVCRPRLEALEDRCLLSGAGSLDTSFGGTGIVTTSNIGEASAVLIQPWDGKIVVAGNSAGGKGANFGAQYMSLARYQPNGSLDSTFGNGGEVVSTVRGDLFDLNAALYPKAGTANDCKIVVASASSTNLSYVARFNINGSLDMSFGKGSSKGSVGVPYGVGRKDVVIQPDGKIVVAGQDTSATEFELTRFNIDGSLDSTFGNGGTATLLVGASTYANGLRLQADGKLVVAGYTGASRVWELARFTANGSLDTSFGFGGTVTTSFAGLAGGTLFDLAIYPTTGTDATDYGKIVVVGDQTDNSSHGQIALARYNVDGTADTTFGQSGQVITPGLAAAVALQLDGKVVVAGWSSGASGSFSLLRYDTTGNLDTTFGNGGIVQTASNPFTLAVAIYPYAGPDTADYGKIVAAGSTSGSSNGYYDLVLARYLNQPLIGSFTASANSVTAGSTVTLTAAGVTGSGTITQVAFYVQVNGTNTLLGTGTQTSPGVWTFTFTVNLTPGTYTLSAVAEDSSGLFSDPFALALTVQ